MKICDIEQVPEIILGVNLSLHEREVLANGGSSLLHENLFDGKNFFAGKFWLSINEDGDIEVNIKKKENILFIPKKINDHTLSEDERVKLSQGEPVLLKNKDGSSVSLIIDTELNCISFSYIDVNEKQISAKDIISQKHKEGGFSVGGYQFSDKEVEDLLNGKKVGPRVIKEDGQHFVTSFKLSSDGNALIFDNYHFVSKEAATLINEQLSKEIDKNGLKIDNNEIKQTQSNNLTTNNIENEIVIDNLKKTDTKVLYNSSNQLVYKSTVEQANQNVAIASKLSHVQDNNFKIVYDKDKILSFNPNSVTDEFKNLVDNYNITRLGELQNNGKSLSNDEISYVISSSLSQVQKDTILSLYNIDENKVNAIKEHNPNLLSDKQSRINVEEGKSKLVDSRDESKRKPGKSFEKQAGLIRSIFNEM